MKARIKQNAWGNWYGYLGTKKVIAFTNTSPGSGMEEEAQAWLKENTDLIPCSIVKVKYVGNDGKKHTIYLENSKIIDKSKGKIMQLLSQDIKFVTGYEVDKHGEAKQPPKGIDSVLHMIQLGDGVTVIPQLQSKMYGDLHDQK